MGNDMMERLVETRADLYKRIAELEAELRAVNRECEVRDERELGYLARAQSAEAERDALKLDAERYRKLVRSGRYSPSPFGWWGLRTGNLTHVSSKEEFDAAIDAAKER